MMNVGILIPTYNRKQYLDQALKSVLDQTHRELEIIVIDNGSTDGTSEFMAGIKDPRVRYIINEKNIGMIGSINKGIALFSKDVEWCTVLSDDDFLDWDCIANLMNAARVSGAKSIVHGHRIYVDKSGKKIRKTRTAPREETALDYFDMRSRGWRETYLTGVLFNRAAFQKIGGYPPFSTGLASDDAFIFALSLQDRLVFEPAAVASIRIHAGAESRTAADGIDKLGTIKEFISYCLDAMERHGNILPEQKRSFVRCLQRYQKRMNSHWWRLTVHAALDRHDNKTDDELAKLRARVLEDRRAFSRRIRLNVLIEDVIKINPETCGICRVAGELADYVIAGMRRLLP